MQHETGSAEGDGVGKVDGAEGEVVEVNVEWGEVVEDLGVVTRRIGKEGGEQSASETKKRNEGKRRDEEKRKKGRTGEKGKGRGAGEGREEQTHDASFRLDKHPRSKRLERVAQSLGQDVRALELREVVGEGEVGGRGETSRLTDTSAEELAEVLGFLDEGGRANEDARECRKKRKGRGQRESV